MDIAEDAAAVAQSWLARLEAAAGAAAESLPLPASPAAVLAAMAAEALARGRTLLLVTPDDGPLPDISNALDLNLRPLCLVLPAADYASRIALRATLSLLKSRLARAGEDADGPAWAQQRQRLAAHAGLWHECLAWSGRGLDREPWPAGIEQLYPVRILPLALARSLAQAVDWAVLLEPARFPADRRGPWPGARRTLLLGDVQAAGGPLATVDETARLRAELEVLTQELSDLELELATAQAEIADFTHRYHLLVGGRLAELDALQADIASHRAEAAPADETAAQRAAETKARSEQSRREQARFDAAAAETAKPFAPHGGLKKLYRHLAQKIHPDRANDDTDRAWRTQLMAEANRAYRAGDETALREMLALWQEGVRPPRQAAPDGLAAQVAQLKRRIAEIEGELNRLFGSKLYELFTAANMARRHCRDLLQEMADRLDGQIAAARAELAAFDTPRPPAPAPGQG